MLRLLVLVVLAFVAMSLLPGLLSSIGPILFLLLAVLAFVYVPALRRMAIGLLILAFLAYLAYSAASDRYRAAKNQVAAATSVPEAFMTEIHDALFVPGLYTTGDSVAGSWLDWFLHGYRRFEGTPFVQGPQDSCCIDANDVEQGALGDCFVLASLAALAITSPGTIANAIRGYGGGAYEVTLHLDDGKGNLRGVPIEVDDTFPGFRWPYSMTNPNPLFAQFGDTSANRPELWVMLIEKAFAQVQQGGYLGLNLGGRGFDTLRTMTGQPSIVVHPHQVTKDNLATTLASLERSGYAITAGSLPANQVIESGPDPLLVGKDAKLASTHEYYVRHYDPATWKVTLGNQHTRGLTVELTLDEFQFAFDSVFFNRPPTVAGVAGCTCP